PSTDTHDKTVQGLVLVKTGPTATNASAGATLIGVKGITLTELGYDLRKPDAFTDIRGSHCSAIAPRFSVVTQDNVKHSIGCTTGLQQTAANWIRLRFALSTASPAIAPTATVKS